MPRIIQTEVFTIDELIEKFGAESPVVNKLIEDQSRIHAEMWRADDYIIPDISGILDAMGFYDFCIEYSGFWSQGDGARIIGKWRRPDYDAYNAFMAAYPTETVLHHWLARMILRVEDSDIFTAEMFPISNMYSHENTVGFNYEAWDVEDNEVDFSKEVMQAFMDDMRELMKEIYQRIEQCYEDETGDRDYLIEHMIANNLTFTAKGEFFSDNIA